MSSIPLPTSRAFVTSLIEALNTQAPDESATQASTNPLKDASQLVKSLLLTLHVLFPNELLPALDVLDRQLVTRLRLHDPSSIVSEGEDSANNKHAVYFVRSAQQHHYGQNSARFSNPMNTYYEVQPHAWNCSCPAFSFSAFPVGDDRDATTHPPIHNMAAITNTIGPATGTWTFGGLSVDVVKSSPPACKHILACVLAERCPTLFGAAIQHRDVGREELAGWCVGWGD